MTSLIKNICVGINKKHHKIVKNDLLKRDIKYSKWLRTKEQQYIEERFNEK